MRSRLGPRFFDRDVLVVAEDLLGATITHEGVAVQLTELEAYAGIGDPGSHAHRGMTPRTRALFGAPGDLYVYFTYGRHWCANLVTGSRGSGAAVLLRAGRVVAGEPLARQRRGDTVPTRDLARGPARLAVALGLDGEHNGLSTTAIDSPVVLRGPEEPATDHHGGPRVVSTGPRVGVSGPGGDGAAYPWRFWIDGDPTVSTYRPAVPRRRSRRPGAG